jgi:hypothetical protein
VYARGRDGIRLVAENDDDTKGVPERLGPADTRPESSIITKPNPHEVHLIEKGVKKTLLAFRLSLIESGTDAGTAFLFAERLRRWMAANEDKLG